MGSNIQRVQRVLVLTNDNFKKSTKGKMILVNFYAPNSKNCRNMAIELQNVANKLAKKKSPWLIGKVDCSVEMELAEKFDICAFPTLIFFNGKTGKNVTASPIPNKDWKIYEWLKGKINWPAVYELASIEAAKNCTKLREVSIVGYFSSKESEAAKAYWEAAWEIDGFYFAIVYKKEIALALEFSEEGVILFRKLDEPQYFEDELTVDNLRKFIKNAATPLGQVV